MGFAVYDNSGRLKTSPLGTTAVTVTTTGNIDDLDFSNASMIRMDNASLATIRGLKAGTAGQIVTIWALGAGQVNLAHLNAGSAVGNRLSNVATSASTSLSAGSGHAIYQYDATLGRWHLIAHEQGAWIDVAFDAANFTGSGSMTFTLDSADQTTFAYLLRGATLEIAVVIDQASVGGTPDLYLQVAIPGGFTSSRSVQVNPSVVLDNAVIKSAADYTVNSGAAGSALLKCTKIGGATNWTASTNNTYLYFNTVFPVQ